MSQTFTQLRRTISRRMREPFFIRQPNGFGVVGGGSSNYFYDAALKKFTSSTGWPYGWAFIPYTTDGLAPIGQELEISNFISNGTYGYTYTDPAPTAAFGAGDQYELHEFCTVQQKKDYINQAIADSYPAFYQITEDQSIVSTKFTREYSLASIVPAVRNIISVYFEPLLPIASGQATGADFDYVEMSGANFVYETGKTYEVAIYYGTGMGQARPVDLFNSTSTKISVNPPFSVMPDTTSQFILKNVSDVYGNWIGPLTKWRSDAQTNPTKIEILSDQFYAWGGRIRIRYASLLSQITGETSTVEDNVVGYIIPRVLYYYNLDRLAAGPQFETTTSEKLALQYKQESEEYSASNRMPPIPSTVRTDAKGYYSYDTERPFTRN